VARALSVAPAHVSRTRALYLAQGLDGLADRRCDNGHRKVTEEFREAVTALLLKVPPDFGWMRPSWTRELRCLETERRGFERVAPCTTGRLLSALGARLGRPKPIVLCPWPRRRRLRILRKIRQLEQRASATEPVLYADEVDIHRCKSMRQLLANVRVFLSNYRWSRVSQTRRQPLRAAA